MRGALAVTALAALAWGEYVSWRASRQGVNEGRGATTAVVVLGFHNGGDRANAVNRWRVRAAMRSAPRSGHPTLVFAGGAVAGETSEAVLMARYASHLGAADPILLEEGSLTTWQNVANVVPLVGPFDRIMIISDPLHALRARQYLYRQRPDLADRLVRGREYRFGEWSPVKVPLAVLGLWWLRPASDRAPPVSG